MRIKGISIPTNILLVDLNQVAYLAPILKILPVIVSIAHLLLVLLARK